MKDLHVFLLASALVLTGYIVLINSINTPVPAFRPQQDPVPTKIISVEHVIPAPIPTEHLKSTPKESSANLNTFPHYSDTRSGVIVLGMHRSGTSGTLSKENIILCLTAIKL